MNPGPRSEHDRRAPFRRSAANDAPPPRGFVNESADVWEEEEERSRAADAEVGWNVGKYKRCVACFEMRTKAVC